MLTILPHKEIIVKRFAPGILERGTYIKGASSSVTIIGSVSAASPNDIARLEEGKRTRQAYLLLTESTLTVAAPGITPDWIYFMDDWYEISTINNWTNTVMDHVEYIITKIENPQDYLPVIAGFTYASTGSKKIKFTNTSIDEITSYLWTFGDSQTSTSESPEHTYSTTGNKTVKLTIYRGILENSITQTVAVS